MRYPLFLVLCFSIFFALLGKSYADTPYQNCKQIVNAGSSAAYDCGPFILKVDTNAVPEYKYVYCNKKQDGSITNCSYMRG